MALKKKKLYEGQLEQIETNILRLNEQQMMLENQRTTVSTVAALASAAKASKQTMAEMNIDKIEDVLDAINEQSDQMQQINDAMSNPIGAAADLDEDEMLKELEVRTNTIRPATPPAVVLPPITRTPYDRRTMHLIRTTATCPFINSRGM